MKRFTILCTIPYTDRRHRQNSIELLISSYYNIVKRTMIDMVPKAVMLNLVQYVSFLYLSLWSIHLLKHIPSMPCFLLSLFFIVYTYQDSQIYQRWNATRTSSPDVPL